MPKLTSENSSNGRALGLTSSTDGNYLRGELAQDALMAGVMLVNDAVAPTLGPKGKDAILEAFEWPYSIATNDGASIAERVKSNNGYEQMGVRLIQEAIGRANKESGDGSTTTCVLTAAILKEGQQHDSSELRSQLKECLPVVLEAIDKQTKPIEPEDVWKVAAVSAQDEEVGKMVGEIYQKIGKDGVVDWDNSHTDETSYEIKEGVELKNVGFVHRSLVNAGPKGPVQNPFEGDRIVLTNPQILITAEKINNASQLEPYVRILRKDGINELVVFCDEIEPMALAEIEATALGIDPRTMQRIPAFKIVVLRAPTLWKDWIYEDFARMTGASVFGIGEVASFRGAASTGWLGTCEKIVCRKTGTDIIGTKDISDHVAELKEKAKEHRELEKRVEWLNSKSAVVRMGARSEVELTYKRLKFDDAKNAAKLALKGGVVPGGGYVFTHIELPDNTAGKVLAAALNAPIEQIAKNSGTLESEEELIKQGVWDPALVAKNAISAAISVASTVLNCNTLIPLDKTQQKYG